MYSKGAAPDGALQGAPRYLPTLREFIDRVKLANRSASRFGTSHV